MLVEQLPLAGLSVASGLNLEHADRFVGVEPVE